MRRLAVLAVLLLLAGCAPAANPAAGWRDPAAVPQHVASEDPAALAAGLSDVDLVGQVLVPYAYGLSATDVSDGAAQGNQKYAGVDTPAQMIARYRLGGLMLVNYTSGDATAKTNPTTNIESPAQVRDLTAGLQSAARALPAGVPLLIGLDQEYGWVTRIRDGVVQLPSGMGAGAAGDPKLTEAAWAAAGADLATLGINADFAPDADVLGPGNAVIGTRSFGSSAPAVSTQVAAAVRGLHAAGVAATVKHFPGHGHTTVDSHDATPVLTQSMASLQSGDLPPFTSAIAAGTDLVMSGHLDVHALDPGTPASFSSKVLIDLLRTRLGFQGVVITDALNMAPAQRWPPGEAAVRAILAGNDMLLQPLDLAATQQGLLDALKSGQLPRARMLQAVTRILALKLRLVGGPPPGPLAQLDSADRQAAAARLTAASVTVLKGGCTGALVHGSVTVTSSGGRDQQRGWLTDALKADGVEVADGSATEVHLVGYGDTADDLAPKAAVTVAMDTPVILAKAASPVRLATYASTQAAMTALAAVLAGKASAPGRSPVDVPGLPRSACKH